MTHARQRCQISVSDVQWHRGCVKVCVGSLLLSTTDADAIVVVAAATVSDAVGYHIAAVADCQCDC